jgi:hypothetical protein
MIRRSELLSKTVITLCRGPIGKRGSLIAALVLALGMLSGRGWASVTNCPAEPKQGVTITSGETYYGSNCVLSTAADVDGFNFNASAGDTWKMVASSANMTYPDNICLTLYGPGGTTVFSGCSNTAGVVSEIPTIQTLATTGTYSIAVTETQNDVIDYGLSLERLSPAPGDGTKLTLGTPVTGTVAAPSSQSAYTFYGATTGLYGITASMTSEGYPYNLCVGVYQPNGLSVTSFPVCTNTAGNVFDISANFTPTQDGIFVLVVYEFKGLGTPNFNLSVSCLSGTCPNGTTKLNCSLKDVLAYNKTTGTLTMNFTLATPVAATWNGWLVSGSTTQLLWSTSEPYTEPATTITQTQAVPKSGKVGILSTLTTPTSGITCSSWAQVNTGTP